jgi:hypothetical protein
MGKYTVAQIITGLIPIYSPVLVAGIKRLMPRVPHVLLPGIAVVVGVLGQAALAWIDGRAADPVWGAALGAVGVVVRDFVKEAKEATR